MSGCGGRWTRTRCWGWSHIAGCEWPRNGSSSSAMVSGPIFFRRSLCGEVDIWEAVAAVNIQRSKLVISTVGTVVVRVLESCVLAQWEDFLRVCAERSSPMITACYLSHRGRVCFLSCVPAWLCWDNYCRCLFCVLKIFCHCYVSILLFAIFPLMTWIVHAVELKAFYLWGCSI